MGMTTLLSSKLNSDRGSCSRTLVSRTKFFFIDWPGGSLGRDLVVVRLAFWLLVTSSIGTEPTRPGRSNTPTRGTEQLLHAPGYRGPGHAVPGEPPPEAGQVEPVGAPPPATDRSPARDGAHRPGHARVQGRDHEIRRPRHPFDTGPYAAEVQRPGEQPQRPEPGLVAQGLESRLCPAIHEDEVACVGPCGVEAARAKRHSFGTHALGHQQQELDHLSRQAQPGELLARQRRTVPVELPSRVL